MTSTRSSFIVATLLLSGTAFGASACSASSASGDDPAATSASHIVTEGSIASLALENVGKGACSLNTHGSYNFGSSCTGNGGQPEYWCADFAKWVWAEAGASNTSELTAAAGSFYVYGQRHGTLHSNPVVGDAVVFNYAGNGYADHVALVVRVHANGTIETVSGDWNGQGGSQAEFASTASADLNVPAYPGVVGSTPGTMGMQISGFISPVGSAPDAPPGPPTAAPPGVTGCGLIHPGHGLTAGESASACDGVHSLVMQHDGNLVLYGSGVALWQSDTAGTDGYVAIMQTDGNLVVYGRRSNALWDSHTNGHFGVNGLTLQDDGNMVLYDTGSNPIWSSETAGQ